MSSPNNHFISNVHIKKCGYMVAIIHKNDFIKLGGDFIEDSNVYYIKKDYDGSSTGETDALLAVGYNELKSFLEDNDEKTNFLNIVKNSYELSYVEDIENINMSDIQKNILIYFSSILENMDADELILLNIEPRGRNKKQLKIYPHPCISIPGGNMEKTDFMSFEKCAVREFYEETGIDINNRYKIASIKKHVIVKSYFKDKITNQGKVYSVSYPNHKSTKGFENYIKNKSVRIEMTFFLARLK